MASIETFGGFGGAVAPGKSVRREWPDWQPIETAPKDENILLHGVPESTDEIRFGPEPRSYSGYWDEIDGAWCMSGATWVGPFIAATHWMPLPSAPNPTTGGER